MRTLNEDLTGIKAIEDKLTANKVTNFAYTDHAYANPLTEADGVEYYDVDNEQNIPLPDPSIMDVNETVLSKGFRSQASSIPRMLMNHFLGRVSYNLNKLNDNMSSLLATLMSHLGSANGIAPLNANGLLDIAKGGTNASSVDGARTNLNIDNVVNTGDSATPTENGTTKFTTGGAYTELNKKADKTQLGGYQPNDFLALSSNDANDVDTGIKCYRVSASCANIPVAKIGLLNSYKYVSGQYIRITQEYTQNDDTVNSAKKYLRWGMSNNNGDTYTWSNWQQIADNADVNLKADLLDLAPAFSASTAYAVGDYVIYSGNLYRCTVAHSAGAWNASHFTAVTVGGDLEAKANQTDLAVPSDAVLHYSFDDVPDYPDGTADVRLIDNNTYQIQNTDYAFTNDGSTTLSNSNGKLLLNMNGTSATAGAYIGTNSKANKTIKLKLNVQSLTGTLKLYFKPDVSVDITSVGIYEYSFNNGMNNRVAIYTTGGNSADVLVEQIYIGDGSYTTPIIDNTSGQNNATNNGGVAVQGVSGKGVLILKNSIIQTSYSNLLNLNAWSLSFWVYLKRGTNSSPRVYGFGLLEYCFVDQFSTTGNYFHFNTFQNNDHKAVIDIDLSAYYEKFTHFVVTTEIEQNNAITKRLWINGKLVGSASGTLTQRPTYTNGYIGSSGIANQCLENSMFDDFQIFERALSADEVTALYLNKANTPKFYDINNYNIDNATPVPAQNSKNLFTAGGAFDFFGGNTKADAWLGRVFSWALGKNWSQGTGGTDYSFYTVYCANNIWVAGSTRGLWWSTDGKNWTQGTGATDYTFMTVYYANGIWVAGSASHGLWWSTDGKNWTQGTGSMTSYVFNAVYCADGIWVAGSTGHGLWWSTDGKAWIRGTGATDYGFSAVYYANNIWVAGSANNGLWWSTDGKTWTQGTGATGNTFYTVYYANNIWVACSESHGLWWSTDGKSWTQGTGSMTSYRFNSVYYANGIWVASSVDYGLWWSTDGKAWIQGTGAVTGAGYPFNTVYYANGIWVVNSSHLGIWYSDFTNAGIQ